MLSGDEVSGAMMLAFGAVGITVAYGIARLMTVGFQQLRDALFAAVGQRAAGADLAVRNQLVALFVHQLGQGIGFGIGFVVEQALGEADNAVKWGA